MSRIIKRTWLILLLTGLLVACAAPATSTPAPVATQPAPATAQPEPTTEQPTPTLQPTPTVISIPDIPGEQVAIPVDTETINATVTGNGEIAVLFANDYGNQAIAWLPLIDNLRSNKKLSLVTFAYRDEDGTSATDTKAVFDYLRAQGINKIICAGGFFGAGACAALRSEPEIAGMVLFTSFSLPALDAGFPKLFLATDTDVIGDVGGHKRAYEQSAEPKAFKSYAVDGHGTGLFTNSTVGTQVLADITDFINGVVNNSK